MSELNGQLLANRSHADRPASDFYPTPPECTEALMRAMNFAPSTVFWECAAGEGAISNVLLRHGFEVRETDLFNDPPVDFLTTTEPPDGATFILTNPPFRMAHEFIEHAMNMPQIVGFAFLLKSQFWHAAKRLQMFRQRPPAAILPLTWRPDFCFGDRGGSPTMECLWTVWTWTNDALFEKEHTIYYPLEKPRDQSLFNQ